MSDHDETANAPGPGMADADTDQDLAPEFDENAGQLFRGDRGELPARARAVLAAFLRRSVLDADAGKTQKDEWDVLLRHRDVIASRLNDMYLRLRIDENLRVAWKEQVEIDGRAVPRLIAGTGMSKWSIQAVLLMVYLRNEMHRQTVEQGQPIAYVYRDQMMSHMLGARPTRTRDEVTYRKQCEKAIESLENFGFIDAGRKTSDRFRISGAVGALFTVDVMRSLLDTYFDHVPEGGPAPERSDQDPKTGEEPR